MDQSSQTTVIACDESGSEGDNLLDARDPAFVLASTSLSIADADALMDRLRYDMPSQAPEFKSKIALRQRHRPALLNALDSLADAGNIHLVDKSYFVTAKLADVLLAGDFVDIGLHGRARADYLASNAAVAVGSQRWYALLGSFATLLRGYRRAGRERPAPDTFFTALHDARANCQDGTTGVMLHRMWAGCHKVVELAAAPASAMREIDPMWPSLVAVAQTWTVRLGDVPLEFVADNCGSIGPDSVDELIAAAGRPFPVLGLWHPGAELRGIRFVDSRSDSRVQVADILAGVGGEISRLAFAGVFDDPLQIHAHPLLDANLMCATGSPIDALSERRDFPYLEQYLRQRGG
ncbi:DUF3800 domain-containing protein [Microbacterium sp. SL62]|uniref:DUF3800 domain-containing protein n=1 Tax=Microbacterium sp. SL62 TaxID=2995139 RepID=UPI002273E455|nr:DUF3800 domain-containing protein [Microbacterium sp. SL62]MCY1715853.1 DUF3800 domain-containing protein [Microbacterium sp. SL62]